MTTRIDHSHAASLESASPDRRPGGRPAALPASQVAAASSTAGAIEAENETPWQGRADACGSPPEETLTARLLGSHAADLINRLQTWAEQLDAREAELASRETLLERAERKARMQEQQRRRQLDDIERTLNDQQKQLTRRLTAAAMALGDVYAP